MTDTNRPISPHLQVYRPQLTSMLSITHRGTGIVLAGGTVFLVYWLFALASGPQGFEQAQAWFGSWLGRLVLLGFSFSLFYHLCNGIRHLFWDIGVGFDIETAYASGRLVVVASVVLTLLAWVAGYMVRGEV